MSNMIKAYAVRYKEELRKIDVGAKEEAIHSRIAEDILSGSIKGGFQTLALHAQEGELPAIAGFSENEDAIAVITDVTDGEEAGDAENRGEVPVVPRFMVDPEAMEAWKEEERNKLREEVLAAERVAIRIEMEKALRTQADVILEQARAQGEQVKAKARQVAEEEKQVLFEAAKREGYEAGLADLEQERAAMEASFAEREQALLAEYERKTGELEPMATEVVVGLLQSLTGVLLDSKKGIVTYLVSKALAEAERSSSFLIKVSREDIDEVKGASETLRSLFERDVTLEIVSDLLLKKGECMIETDAGIIDCSLGTQLEGLIEDIRLLSLQGRM